MTGDPRYGVYYKGHLYLCSDTESRQKFVHEPGRYAEVDVADQGYCPHCRNLAGRMVRGKPQFSATHAGLRYLFPDAHHLEAFRASPEKFLRR